MALNHHWKLDDNAASTTVVATVGSNATLIGGDNTSAKSTAGPGTAITLGFDLNGTDDAVDIGTVSNGAASAMSVSLWAKFDASSGYMMGKGADVTGRLFKSGDTTIAFGTVGFGASYTVPSLGTANWHHILATVTSGGNGRLFVDGVESSTGTQALGGTAVTYNYIGRASTTYFDGKIAYVKIFDTDESANAATLYAEKDAAGGAEFAGMMGFFGGF